MPSIRCVHGAIATAVFCAVCAGSALLTPVLDVPDRPESTVVLADWRPGPFAIASTTMISGQVIRIVAADE